MGNRRPGQEGQKGNRTALGVRPRGKGDRNGGGTSVFEVRLISGHDKAVLSEQHDNEKSQDDQIPNHRKDHLLAWDIYNVFADGIDLLGIF